MNEVTVKKNEHGLTDSYMINGKELTPDEADAIFRFVQHEYHKGDIYNALKEFLDESGLSDKDVYDVFNEETIENITYDYEHSLENSEDWTYCVDYAMSENEKTLNKIIEKEIEKE